MKDFGSSEYPHNVVVSLEFGKLTTAILWSQDNLNDHWRYEIIDLAGKDTGTYRFMFKNNKDCSLFKLKFQ